MCHCHVKYFENGQIPSEIINRVTNDMTFTNAMQAYTQLWGCLTQSEYCVLGFILNRTVRFKKSSERIPQRHFLEGVYTRENGVLVQAPCAVKSHSTIEKTIKSLSEKELINVTSNKRQGNLFHVNEIILALGCMECRTKRLEDESELALLFM